MSARRKSFRVRLGNHHITVAPWNHPATGAQRWRFHYRISPDAPWIYRTFRTRDHAEQEATQILEAIATGSATLHSLPGPRRRWLEEIHRLVSMEDEPRVLDFIRAMHQSSEVSAAVARFMTSRITKAGEETPHLATARSTLESMARHFHGRSVADIHLPDLQAWFDARTVGLGWKRSKDIRATLRTFWTWARKQGLAGSAPDTVADRLPEAGSGERGTRRTLTPAEFQSLAEEIAAEWRPWLVLGCFAGLRPEEIAPDPGKKKSAKRGLRCEEIDWQFQVIRLPAEVSKGGKRPRNIPMSEALQAWLRWSGILPGMTGPVCLRNPSQAHELARLGSLVFGGPWPKDIARHTYASMRNAILRNLPQVAEEMGTSVHMLHHHYHNPAPTATGEAWFSLRPDAVPICSDAPQGAPTHSAIRTA